MTLLLTLSVNFPPSCLMGEVYLRPMHKALPTLTCPGLLNTHHSAGLSKTQSVWPWCHLTNCRFIPLALDIRVHSGDSTGPIRHWSDIGVLYQDRSSTNLVMKASPFGLESAREFSSALVNKPFIIQNRSKRAKEKKWFIHSTNICWTSFIKPGTALITVDKAEKRAINIPSYMEQSVV